jgi:hypothetical protein
MHPVFKPGEVVLVQPLIPRPPSLLLSPGDCAVYELDGRVLLHRVIKARAEGVRFADDAGRLEPHLVPWEKIRGRVLSRNPLSGGFCGLIYSKLRRSLSRYSHDPLS